MKYYSVAIDGPSGAGKSTMARALASKLGYLYVDTGAIYRTLGLFALSCGVSPSDPEGVSALLPKAIITMNYGEDGLQHMYLGGQPEQGGEDVTEAIRTPEVSTAASKISAIPAVRAFLLEMQRDIARHNNVIMDGRDIGTAVLPQADVKIFLTASPQARAQRRYAELAAKGNADSFENVLRDITERDERDSNRSAAPLRQAEDAVLFDSTDYSPEECVERLLEIIQEKTV